MNTGTQILLAELLLNVLYIGKVGTLFTPEQIHKPIRYELKRRNCAVSFCLGLCQKLTVNLQANATHCSRFILGNGQLVILSRETSVLCVSVNARSFVRATIYIIPFLQATLRHRMANRRERERSTSVNSKWSHFALSRCGKSNGRRSVSANLQR